MPIPREFQQMDSGVEPMQVDEGGSTPTADFTVDNPEFDLDSYASSYSGLAKIRRLMFIAKHCPNLRVDSLKLALAAIEQTHNTSLYSELRQRLQQATGDETYSLDQENAITFISVTNRKAAILLERLDSDLKNYRSNAIKESIRRGFDALGDHYLDCGELNQALKMYMRARDHCTSAKHIIQLCLNVIKVSVLLGNWQQVINYYNKAEASIDSTDVSKLQGSAALMHYEIASRLACAAGLAEMENKKYKNAARCFLMCSVEHCKFSDLISPYSVAVYGGLCVLASFDRQDIYDKVLTSSNHVDVEGKQVQVECQVELHSIESSFKQFLELEPQLRDVIHQFHLSHYTSSLHTLEEMRETLMLDMYLASHISVLYKMIRNKALIQYFSPYVSVDLQRMAEAFNTSTLLLENELTQLILDGQISARIDSHAKIMYARNIDQRSAVFQKALEVGEAYHLRTKALLIRSLLQKHNICVSHTEIRGSGEGDISESVRRMKPKP